MNRFSLVFLFLILFSCAFGEETNLEIIFSYETEDSEFVKISYDSLACVLHYSFTISDSIVMEVFDDLSDSIVVFEYSYYLRGGGPDNCGLDLNSFIFTIDSTQYEVYQDYSAEEDMDYVGLRVFDLRTSEDYDAPGLIESYQGHLMHFRFTGMIPDVDEW